MPAKPSWLLRIPHIIAALSALHVPIVDRATCEKLFGLRRRQTIHLLQSFGGYRAGSVIVLNREDLIRKLQELQKSPAVEYEHRRKRKIAEEVAGLEASWAAKRIVIEPSRTGRTATGWLPEGVRFGLGTLTVEFADVPQLLSRLYDLAQAAARDFDRFCSTAKPQ
jgi:hypothetical protein